MIVPSSAFIDNLEDIEKSVIDAGTPVVLSKDGRGYMVVISLEAFSDLQFEAEMSMKLLEAEREEEYTDKRYSLDEVRASMMNIIDK